LRAHNFSAGPCTLPLSVLEEAQAEFVDYHGAGASLIEMSHRGPAYDAVHMEALALARSVAQAPDDFEVLFVGGGATMQFAMAPMNLLSAGDRGAVAVTGAWSKKGLSDGLHHGDLYSAFDGGPEYRSMPSDDQLHIEAGTRYLHVCSNETIGGIRFPSFPDVGVPLVIDMSSEYLSRPIPWDRTDVVFGGVQKNLGPSGMAIVYVRKSVLEAAPTNLASALRYQVYAQKDSMYNTPPVFTIWMTGKVLRWIDEQGGTAALEASSAGKAKIIYDIIDNSSGFFRSPVETRDRSHTNVVFRLPTVELEQEFLAATVDANMMGLKGHRDVGGLRASMYAALPEQSVEALAGLMTQFRTTR
jgi:phosphoserine aminotransferase